MILAKLAGAALIVSVATGPVVERDGAAITRMSLHQKNAAMQPLLHRATECIAQSVAAQPGFHGEAPGANLGDLIVASVPHCLGPVRAMIDAYDRYFGDGAGEAFFMGPYLDLLPGAVISRVKNRPE
jgi:hypothetical protein